MSERAVRLQNLAAALLLLFLGIGCASPVRSDPPPRDLSGNRVIGEYLVLVKEGTAQGQIVSHFSAYNVLSISAIEKSRYLIRLERDPGPEAMADLAKAAPFILEIQPNFVYRINPPGREYPKRR